MPHTKRINYRLLLKVSKLYYEGDKTQVEISKRLNLSRPKISRLLKQAEDLGIVKISIVPQPGIHTELEEELEKKYDMAEVVVVEVSEPSSQIAVSREIGIAAADYFARAVSDPCVIGISWGTTLRAMADAIYINACPNSLLVQLIGGLGAPESEAHVTYILRRIVAQLNSKLSILNFPGILNTVAVKEAVLTNPDVKEILNLFNHIDIAFVGIGVPMPESVLMCDGTILSKTELDLVLDKGAVGDICLRFFDKDGSVIQSEIDDRVIGISIASLKKIDRVVGVAGGPKKVEVIHAALKGRLINVLVTDHVCAKKILEDT